MNNERKNPIKMIVEITKNDDDTRTVCLKHSVAFESDAVPMR